MVEGEERRKLIKSFCTELGLRSHIFYILEPEVCGNKLFQMQKKKKNQRRGLFLYTHSQSQLEMREADFVS
jgi:hypothetical protein